MRVLIITAMRNEAPFILEWIAYHRHIGVTDFLIYSNDCDDGTDLMLDRLAALGLVTHERNHSGGKKPVQWRALTKAARHPVTAAADWIYVADVDEFLNIHAGDGRIADLLAACPTADGFAIPWRMFGNNGVDGFVDAPVRHQFTKAAPDALVWPWKAVQFKSLYRNSRRYDKLGVHQPGFGDGDTGGGWVDGNGAPCPMGFGTAHLTTAPRYGLAQINHYALGAMDSFLVKQERGKPNHVSESFDLSYWVERNFETASDTSIRRHDAAVAAQIAALMEDPELARLHRQAVQFRHARIAELKALAPQFAFYCAIRQTGPTNPLPMDVQQQLLRAHIAIRRGEKASGSQ